MNHKSIWNFKQNKPTYIVRDIRAKYPEVPEDFIYEVLLKRGVFKWLAVRRDLIKLKDEWRYRVRDILFMIKYCKMIKGRNLLFFRGKLKGYEECRKQLRELCHSERWQAPDNDREAIEFLRRIDAGTKF